MNFEFSQDQEALRSEVRRFLQKRCPSSAVRRVLDGDAPYDAELWRALGEMGWGAVALPEHYGGSGMGQLELCVIAEELGRALAPVPYSSSIYLAADALVREGSDAQREAWLPRLGQGAAIGTFALSEGPGSPAYGRLETRARLDGGTLRLRGTKWPVADGLAADLAVVAAVGPHGPGLFLVDLTAPGVARHPEPSIDESRPQARVTFDDAAAEPLGNGGAAAIDRVLSRAAVLYAFEQIGGADACLALGVEYAKQRYAFGRPIGSFQAIKHRLADLYGEVELARSNCYYAAWALANDDAGLAEAAACARLSASRAYELCAREVVQVHGGSGFTWDVDAHLYYRRSKLLSTTIGGSARWRERLVGLLEAKDAARGGAAR